jgi:hypothetical protein
LSSLGATPDHVVTDREPARLLETIRAANRGADVRLIGGPTTIETYRGSAPSTGGAR